MKLALTIAALMVVSGCAQLREIVGEDCVSEVEDAIESCREDARDTVADELDRIRLGL